MVVETDINTYNGRQSVRLLIKDIRYSDPSVDEVERLKERNILPEDIPEREDTVALYRYFQKQNAMGTQMFDFYTLPDRINSDQRCPISLGAVYFSMKILRELGVLEYQHTGPIVSNLQIHAKKRVSLQDSVILNEIRKKVGEIG